MSGDGPSVLLLCGGRSGEHEVSLASAASVLAAAEDRIRFAPRVVARDGRLLSEAASRRALAAGRSDDVEDPDAAPDLVRGVAALAPGAVDAVFPLLHGPNGEDGTVQGLLELLDVAYVGADVLGSACGMDKPTMKRLFAAEGLPQVAWREVAEARWRAAPDAVRAELAPLGWPLFAKPANLGSSVGIGRVGTPEGLDAALDEAFAHDRRAIVEAGVAAPREVEVAVLGDEAPETSPPGEIRVRDEGFYDYERKYGEEGAELIVPAPLPPATADRLRELAVRAFAAVHASGLARVDFFVAADGEVLLNEINTMPGFTRHSMYPKLWAAAGLAYPDLVARLVDLALARHARQR